MLPQVGALLAIDASITRASPSWRRKARVAKDLLSESLSFRTLMIGSSVSMLGSRISTVAFPMLVLYLDHSPMIAGFVAFVGIAPSILFYIPAGVLVDRWNPRSVMIASETLRGMTIASIIVSLISFGKHTSILLLMAGMVCEEILEIFSNLADRRCLSRLMERNKIAKTASSQANIEVRVHAAVLAGRPIAPWLFSVNWLAPFIADALSFLFSVGSLLIIPKQGDDEPKPEPMSVRQLRGDVSQGFRWLWKNRHARVTISFMALTSLIAQALIMIFLAEAHAKELSTMGIGIVLGASGVGGALGSVMVRMMPAAMRMGPLHERIDSWKSDWKERWKKHWLKFQLIAWSAAIGILAIGAFSPWWIAGAMFVLGFTGAIGNIAFGAYLIKSVADNMLARVTSIGQVLMIGACALGPAIGGVAIQFCGPRVAVWVLFGAVAVAAVVAAWIDREFTHEIPGSRRWSSSLAARPEAAALNGDRPAELPRWQTGESAGGVLTLLADYSVHQRIVDRSRYSYALR
jgi:MFS family permease